MKYFFQFSLDFFNLVFHEKRKNRIFDKMRFFDEFVD